MNILLLFPGFIIAFVIVFYYKRKIKRTKPRNNVHFYVARDKKGTLWLYMGKPVRCDAVFYGDPDKLSFSLTYHNFKYLGLNENDYTNLKWEDEPVEVFLNLED